MVGNPFSPSYARARAAGGRAPALDHCSMHVAIYRRGRAIWSLEEGPLDPRARRPRDMTMGRSWIGWVGDRLVVDLDERSVPFNLVPFRRSRLHRLPPGRPVRGRITIHPEAMPGESLGIDADGLHRWWPIAPTARITVELTSPELRFRGHGYHDANAGPVALEQAFDSWTWSRCRTGDRAWLTYDVTDRDGQQRSHALTVAPDGDMQAITDSASVSLGRSTWQLDRRARLPAPGDARVARSLEDGPFYARAVIEQRWSDHRAVAMHETLAAHRLRRRWVQLCAGYRIRAR